MEKIGGGGLGTTINMGTCFVGGEAGVKGKRQKTLGGEGIRGDGEGWVKWGWEVTRNVEGSDGTGMNVSKFRVVG